MSGDTDIRELIPAARAYLRAMDKVEDYRARGRAILEGPNALEDPADPAILDYIGEGMSLAGELYAVVVPLAVALEMDPPDSLEEAETFNAAMLDAARMILTLADVDALVTTDAGDAR